MVRKWVLAGAVLLIACQVRFEVGPSDAGLTQLEPGTPPEISARFLAAPWTAQMSPQGRYVSYVAMTEVPDGGGTSFRSGALMVRDLDTGAELVLRPAPQLTCAGPYFCVFAEAAALIFSKNDARVFVPNLKVTGSRADWSLGDLVDLPSGERVQAATVNWLTSIVQLAPDLSWAIVGQQTYAASSGAIGFLSPLNGVVEPIAQTCMDPKRLERDGVTSGVVALLVLSNCATDGGGVYHDSLTVYPMPMPSRLPPSGVTATVLGEDRGLVGNVFIRPGKVFYTNGFASSHHQLLDGGSRIPIGGELLSVSPDGNWAVVAGSNFGADFGRQSSITNIAAQSAESLGLIYYDRSKGPLPWLDDRTLVFKDMNGGVYRRVLGRAPELIHTGGSNFSLISFLGRVGILHTAASNTQGPQVLTVFDGSQSATFNLPAQSVEAHLFSATTSVNLGTANSWALGVRYSLRGDFQFDAAGHPSPENGFTLVPTP